MNILVIDDERTFPSFEGEGVTVIYARTAEAAKDALLLAPMSAGWDEVWFDHDLGLGPDVRAVVKFMEEKAEEGVRWDKWIRRVFVHSMNPVGAANIRSRIKDFGIPTSRVGLPHGHSVIG